MQKFPTFLGISKHSSCNVTERVDWTCFSFDYHIIVGFYLPMKLNNFLLLNTGELELLFTILQAPWGFLQHHPASLLYTCALLHLRATKCTHSVPQISPGVVCSAQLHLSVELWSALNFPRILLLHFYFSVTRSRTTWLPGRNILRLLSSSLQPNPDASQIKPHPEQIRY